MALATDGSLRNVFWADGRSRASYSQFGDVVVFDVTYKTNKFKIPFLPFVGVNHHRQSILFGAALLEDKTEATFVWLFEQFQKCMFDRPPIAIMIDMDGVMRNAIKKIFPNTQHHFCTWHIKKHVIEHLQSFQSRYSDFNETYNKWVKSETIAEFESGWETLNEKYEIEEKSWLANMYNLRQHWVKAYFKDIFFAGMTTSGRSESINAFFDGYVNSNTKLNDFVVQYDKAIKARRVAEEDEDFKTINSKAVVNTMHPIEKKAGECYTRNLFEIFKKEWNDSIVCFHETLSKEDRVIKYSVGFHVQDKCKWKVVDYDSFGDVTATCSCSKFETEGMLCKHILYIMRKKKLTTLPEHHILPRWMISARYKVGNVGYGLKGITRTPSEKIVTPLTLWSIQAKFNKILENARNSHSDIEKLIAILGSFLEKLSIREKANEMRSQVGSTVGVSHVEQMHQISIRDPATPVKTKGRPKIASRIKSRLELAKKGKKQRKCGLCGGKCHNKTGCRMRKMGDGEGNSSQINMNDFAIDDSIANG